MAWPSLNVIKKLHPYSVASSPKYDHDTSEMGPGLAADLRAVLAHMLPSQKRKTSSRHSMPPVGSLCNDYRNQVLCWERRSLRCGI